MALATSSLPVPLSPVMSTVASVGAMRTMRPSTSRTACERPMMFSNLYRSLNSLARKATSPASRRLSSAFCTFTSSSCSVKGFWM